MARIVLSCAEHYVSGSAKQVQKLNSSLSILQTEGTNHFISLEQPDTIRAID